MGLQVQVDHLVGPPALNVDRRWCEDQADMEISMDAVDIHIAVEQDRIFC